MRPKQLAFTVVVAIIAASLALAAAQKRNQFPSDRIMLAMRWIGDRVLRNAGDTTSRVLPVREVGNKTFQMAFQSEFEFVPDTLVRIVHSVLQSENLPLHYTVTVLACATDHVIYGYRIASKRTTLVPCLGREQPRGCYVIQIAFENEASSAMATTIFSGTAALAAIAALAFVAFGKGKIKRGENAKPEQGFIPVGNSTFSEERRILRNATNSISLTDKEARLLGVLVAHSNEPLDRDRLLKEVWEDDGVIVGRSLDVFVSKLRKKLIGDAAIRIVNIHGKGYKLEVD